MAVTYYWTSPNLSLRVVQSEDIIIFDMLDDETGIIMRVFALE
ncbi:hypothetical protein PAJ34TS1_28050 [Paenibacillus azoreducens]|uniref:Uncharacterized protein n=1 Tax=Paenibacillus azoreducens TaxID=116718 RepID=A0A920CQU3_9BACL|nr:hypothetical protein J34TS1_11540 [Paenibacillus azoreducens]